MPAPNNCTGGTPASFSPLIDCAGSKGTSGQILSSTGTAIRWITGGGGASAATPTALGTVYGCTPGTSNQSLSLGYGALNAPVIPGESPASNLAIGFQSLCSLGGGINNIAIGNKSLFGLNLGICNVALGDRTGYGLTSLACRNTLIGILAGGSLIGSSTGNTFIGAGTDLRTYNTSSGSVLIGDSVLLPVDGVDKQLAIGSNTGGDMCWLTGCPNGDIRPGGMILDNFGCSPLSKQILTLSTFFTGCLAWEYVPTATPTLPGGVLGCMICSTTALGISALSTRLTTPGCSAPIDSVAIGNSAVNPPASYTVCRVVGVGAYALRGGGCEDVSIGWCAGPTVAGNSNVFIGARAGCWASGGFGGNACNVAIGARAISNSATTTISNAIAIGYCAGSDVLVPSIGSNCIVLGNNAITCFISKVPLTVPSDLRWKKVAGDVPLALSFVESLNPIKYQFCDKETGEVTDTRYRYGFSAQEILTHEEITDHPIIVGIDNPDMYSVSETMLFPVLVNAIKELSAEVKSLKAEVAALKST